MRAVVQRRSGTTRPGALKASPVAEPDEDQVAEGRRDEPGHERGEQHRPEREPASTSNIPATSGPPNSAEIAANEPALESTALAWGPTRTKCVTATPTAEPSAITGASGPSTAPNASVPSAASATPGA